MAQKPAHFDRDDDMLAAISSDLMEIAAYHLKDGNLNGSHKVEVFNTGLGLKARLELFKMYKDLQRIKKMLKGQ